MDAERVPVVVATGQSLEREGVLGALDLAATAAESALALAPALRERVDRLSLVSILSRHPSPPATVLAGRLGLEPATVEVSAVGGNSPQWLVNRAAADIAAGRLRATLIVGAEGSWTSREAKRRGEAREAPPPAGAPDPVVGDDRRGVSDAELAIGLALPAQVYPMFESVRAARDGEEPQRRRDRLAGLLAPFTEVAAKHPYAWFAQARTAAEIATPGPDNRVTAEPYTKLMNAFPTVNQGAALLVTSLAEARRAGVESRAVFVWGGADATDVWFPVQRPDLGRSPGIAAATGAALQAAGVGVDEVGAFDLYSCFPVAVQMAAEALGLAWDDPRGLTVTGGLAYFGGPGNNYVGHSIATMTDRLLDGGGVGLVTGLGWYVTKHSCGVYGAAPPPAGFRYGDTAEAQAAIDATALPVAAEADDEEAVVDAATVVYDRDGAVAAVPVFARLADGRRIAAVAAEADRAGLAGRSLVGQRVRISGRPPTFRVA